MNDLSYDLRSSRTWIVKDLIEGVALGVNLPISGSRNQSGIVARRRD